MAKAHETRASETIVIKRVKITKPSHTVLAPKKAGRVKNHQLVSLVPTPTSMLESKLDSKSWSRRAREKVGNCGVGCEEGKFGVFIDILRLVGSLESH